MSAASWLPAFPMVMEPPDPEFPDSQWRCLEVICRCGGHYVYVFPITALRLRCRGCLGWIPVAEAASVEGVA